MERSEIIISGDAAGSEWRVPVFRFAGSDKAAPSVYIQAGVENCVLEEATIEEGVLIALEAKIIDCIPLLPILKDRL